jgi:hypothetical protein
LWIGQRAWIYTGEEYVKRLSRFLFIHRGHNLVFEDENWRDEAGFYNDDNGNSWIDFEKEDTQYGRAFNEALRAEEERLDDKET